MPARNLDPSDLGQDEDWEGNNAAFKCRHCGKVFIVSAQIHAGKRNCPEGGKSTGYCDMAAKNPGVRPG